MEEIVLHALERIAQRGDDAAGEHHAEERVELVDGAVGLDPRAVLRHPGLDAERGGAVVAGAGVDLGDPGHWRRSIDGLPYLGATERSEQRRPRRQNHRENRW